MSEGMILASVVYGFVAMMLFFCNLDSSANGRQVAATALFWPIFGLIHLVIGFI